MPLALVVDDEPDVRLIIRLNLEYAGYDVIEADGGDTALSAIRESPPDLVLLDLRMPGTDGWAVLEHLRDSGILASLRIVAVSAHASGHAMRRALARGCSGYLRKPFTVTELLAMLPPSATPSQP